MMHVKQFRNLLFVFILIPYEGGIRSSLVVWGPGFIKEAAEGTRNKESVNSAIDLVPSLLHFTGTPCQNLHMADRHLHTIFLL